MAIDMENPVLKFIACFSTLEGVPIFERKRNFFKLLKFYSYLKDSPLLVREIVDKLQPQTYLQQLMYLDLLIYYKCTKELFSILKNENNEVLLSKISKQRWFFEEIFNENQIDPEELLNTILPQFSYVIRMKILNLLSKTLKDELFDQVFDSITKRYGNFIANKFVCGCSIGKIKKVIEDKATSLDVINSVQLIKLYKKDNSFIQWYFQKKTRHSHDLTKFFRYLFVNDFKLFSVLRSSNKVFVPRLGKRSTKRLVKLKRNEIIETPENFMNLIDSKTVVRKLGVDSKRFMYNVFLDECDSNFKNFSTRAFWHRLGIFPSKYQYEIFKNFVEKRYSIKIEDHPHLITSELIEVVQNPDERHKLAQISVNIAGKESFIVYMKLSDSIATLKEKINRTSDIWKRKEYILSLVDALHKNNCEDEDLLQVLKYFCSRHRNDDVKICSNFISLIHQRFGLQNLNQEMWNLIDELFKMIHVKTGNEMSGDQFLAYIEFIYKQGKPIQDLLDKYFLKDSSLTTYHQSREFFKFVLLYKVQKFSFEEPDYDNVNEGWELIRQIYCHWNCVEKSNEKIDVFLYPELVKCFKLRMFSADKFSNLTNNIQNLLEILWSYHLKEYLNEKLIITILRCDPLVPQRFDKLQQFLEIIVSNYSTNSSIMNLIKQYSHLNYDDLVTKHCYEILMKNIDVDSGVRCLSHILPVEKFESLAHTYSPTTSKLNLSDQADLTRFRIQRAIASNYKNQKSCKVLPSLINYSVGEYFTAALKSLQSLLRRTPENVLPEYIDFLSDKAVSVRKHALFFTCELCDVTSVETILIKLNESEKTESLRKRYLESTLKYFKKIPCDKIFKLLKMKIKFINKNDLELLTILSEPNEIPLHYQHTYIEFMWEFLEIVSDKPQHFNELRSNLIECKRPVEVVRNFSLEFCSKFINYSMTSAMTFSTSDYKYIDFVTELLREHPNHAEIFDLILKRFADIKLEKQEMLTFLFDCADVFMRTKDVVFLENYLKSLSNLIVPLEHFSYYLQEFFIKLKFQYHFELFNVASFNSKILEFVNDLIKNYGIVVLELFSKQFQFYTSQSYYCSDMDELEFYKHLLRNNPGNVTVAILIIQTLPRINKDDQKRYLLFREIIEILKRQTDPGVIVLFRNRFS